MQAARSRPIRSAVLVAWAGAGVSQAGIHLVTPAIPAVRDAYDLGAGQVGLLTAAFLLPAAVLGLPAGLIADRRGPRLVFVIGFLALGLGGLAIALGPSFPVLLAMRAVQGVGFAILQPVSLGVIAEVLSEGAQGRAQAHRLTIMAGGELLFPVVGGFLVAFGWRWTFAASALSLAGALVAWRSLAGLPGRAIAPRYWSSLVEAARAPRLLNLQLVGFLYFFMKYGYLSYVAALLVDSRGISAATAGLVLGGVGLSAVVTTAAYPLYRDRASSGRLVVVGFVLSGAGLIGTVAAGNVALAAGAGAVFAAGNAVVGVTQTTLVPVVVEPSVRFGFVAVNGATRNLGKAVAPVGGSLIAAAAGIPAVFAAMGIAALAALPTARWLPRPHSPAPTDGVAGAPQEV